MNSDVFMNCMRGCDSVSNNTWSNQYISFSQSPKMAFEYPQRRGRLGKSHKNNTSEKKEKKKLFSTKTSSMNALKPIYNEINGALK